MDHFENDDDQGRKKKHFFLTDCSRDVFYSFALILIENYSNMCHVPRLIQYILVYNILLLHHCYLHNSGRCLPYNKHRPRLYSNSEIIDTGTNKRSICRRLLQLSKSVSSKAAGETVVDWMAGGRRPRQ